MYVVTSHSLVTRYIQFLSNLTISDNFHRMEGVCLLCAGICIDGYDSSKYLLCVHPGWDMQVLQDNLEWEEVQWSQTAVWVSGKEYPLARVHFLSSK